MMPLSRAPVHTTTKRKKGSRFRYPLIHSMDASSSYPWLVSRCEWENELPHLNKDRKKKKKNETGQRNKESTAQLHGATRSRNRTQPEGNKVPFFLCLISPGSRIGHWCWYMTIMLNRGHESSYGQVIQPGRQGSQVCNHQAPSIIK